MVKLQKSQPLTKRLTIKMKRLQMIRKKLIKETEKVEIGPGQGRGIGEEVGQGQVIEGKMIETKIATGTKSTVKDQGLDLQDEGLQEGHLQEEGQGLGTEIGEDHHLGLVYAEVLVQDDAHHHQDGGTPLLVGKDLHHHGGGESPVGNEKGEGHHLHLKEKKKGHQVALTVILTVQHLTRVR